MNLASTGNALQKVLEEARRALLDDDEIEDEESYHQVTRSAVVIKQ